VPISEPTVVDVRDIAPGEFPAAVELLARGFRENPLPVAAFGPDPDRVEQSLATMFGALFRVLTTQRPLVALDGARLVGVAGVALPGTCQPSPAQAAKMLPSLLRCGPQSLVRFGAWMRTWAAHDPDEPHVHLGPLAVDPALRGRGIGSQLLTEFCQQLDEANLMGYLETETEANVRLYRRFGFEVAARQHVLGVPNWFMRRPAAARAPRAG
jgi:ribosomal protein S18 acetylase RimI-like enzyme